MVTTYLVCQICGRKTELPKAKAEGWFIATVSNVTGEMRIVCPDHTHGLTTDDVMAMATADSILTQAKTEGISPEEWIDSIYDVEVQEGLRQMLARGQELLKQYQVKYTQRAMEGQEAWLWDEIPVDAVAIRKSAGHIASHPAVRLAYAVPRK